MSFYRGRGGLALSAATRSIDEPPSGVVGRTSLSIPSAPLATAAFRLLTAPIGRRSRRGTRNHLWPGRSLRTGRRTVVTGAPAIGTRRSRSRGAREGTNGACRHGCLAVSKYLRRKRGLAASLDASDAEPLSDSDVIVSKPTAETAANEQVADEPAAAMPELWTSVD